MKRLISFLFFSNLLFFSCEDDNLISKEEKIEKYINVLKEKRKDIFVTHVTLTVYNPVTEQCDSDPLVTANGTKIDLEKLKKGELKYCAVSRDLLWCLPYGSIVYIEGFGEYLVVDTMNKRFNHYIDILQDENEPIFKKNKCQSY